MLFFAFRKKLLSKRFLGRDDGKKSKRYFWEVLCRIAAFPTTERITTSSSTFPSLE